MKKTLKLLSLVIAVIMMLAVFAACSDKSPNKGNKTDNTSDDTSASENMEDKTDNTSDDTSESENKEDNTDNMTYEEIYKATAKKFRNNKNPVAIIVMESGDAIAFEMYSDKAPNTVLNFISLANKGFYDGVIFHRVIEKFMIQTGDPLGNGTGGPGYMIEGEFSNNDCDNDIHHEAGVVSMARQGNPYYPALAYNTAGSQFFICTDSNNVKHLDGDYAAFGRVIYGMNTVYSIASVITDEHNDRPVIDQKMAYVRVDTHGVQYDEPETIAE